MPFSPRSADRGNTTISLFSPGMTTRDRNLADSFPGGSITEFRPSGLGAVTFPRSSPFLFPLLLFGCRDPVPACPFPARDARGRQRRPDHAGRQAGPPPGGWRSGGACAGGDRAGDRLAGGGGV